MCNKIVERESHQLGGEDPDEMMEVISPIITLVLLGLVLFLSFKICCMMSKWRRRFVAVPPVVWRVGNSDVMYNVKPCPHRGTLQQAREALNGGNNAQTANATTAPTKNATTTGPTAAKPTQNNSETTSKTEETQAKPNNAITSAKTKEAESMVKLELSQNTQPPTVPTGGASAPVDIGYPISTMFMGDIPQGIQQNEHARIISVVPNSEPVYQGAVPKEWFSGSNSMYNQSNMGPVITTTTTPAHPQAAIFIPVIPPPPHVPQRSSMMSTSNYNYDYPTNKMKGIY